jgi:hypothetical protein
VFLALYVKAGLVARFRVVFLHRAAERSVRLAASRATKEAQALLHPTLVAAQTVVDAGGRRRSRAFAKGLELVQHGVLTVKVVSVRAAKG